MPNPSMRWPCLHGRQMLCNTTPRRVSVTTNGLWRVAARAWHEPPPDTCSVVSASPSHSISITIIIPDFPLFFMRFPVGHSNRRLSFQSAFSILFPVCMFEDGYGTLPTTCSQVRAKRTEHQLVEQI